MERLIERCCGLDVHKATVSACVRVTQRPGGAVKQEVRTFATSTPELLGMRGHVGHGRAVLAVGRNVLEIAYHLLGEQTTYRELGD